MVFILHGLTLHPSALSSAAHLHQTHTLGHQTGGAWSARAWDESGGSARDEIYFSPHNINVFISSPLPHFLQLHLSNSAQRALRKEYQILFLTFTPPLYITFSL